MPLPSFLPFGMMQRVPEPEWLVDGILPQGYLAILASAPKTGKTCLATALALAVGSGRPFAGQPTKQTTVLWCCLEESLKERAAMLKLWPHQEDELPAVLTSTEPLRIDDQSGIDCLDRAILENNAGLVVIDPLYAATGGYSLSEANLARRSLTFLKNLCDKTGVTALVLHHIYSAGRRDGHVNGVAESAQLAATASMQMLLTVLHEETTHQTRSAGILPASGPRVFSPQSAKPIPSAPTEGGVAAPRRLVKLACRGRGNAVNRDWLFYSDGPLDFRLTDLELAPNPLALRKQKVVDAIGADSATAADIINRTGLNPGSTRNLITKMLGSKELFVSKTESGVRHFRTPRPR